MHELELGTLLAVAAVGAALLLDNNVLFQGMLSRPLFVGAVFSLWFNDGTYYPLLIGAMLELVWTNVIPGEPRRPSSTFLGVLVAAVIALWPGGWQRIAPLQTTGALFLIVLCGIVVSIIAKEGTLRVRRWTNQLNRRFARAVETGKFDQLFWLNLAPVPLYWFCWFVLLLLTIPLLLVTLPRLVGLLSETTLQGLAFAALAFPILGLAVFTRLFAGRRLKRYIVMGFAITLVLRHFMAPLDTLGILLAIGVGYLAVKRLRRGAA